jgi:polar amino acid transport system substrate-binding protein
MRKLWLLLAALLALAALAAGCGGDDDEGTAGKGASATQTSASDCSKQNLTLVNQGKLTVGTSNPAFPPWFEGEKADQPWDVTKKPTGKGYEAAVIDALAKELGFTRDEVEWKAIPFDQSFRPGPKDFDFDVNQISYRPVRAKAVDFSDSYYNVNQALVAREGSDITKAKSISDLKAYKLGAQIGTTSYSYITDYIKPEQQPSVYNENTDAVSALKAGQIDGIVSDFPSTLYMANVQLKDGTIVGRFPTKGEQEYFGLVFEKGNSLRDCVNKALDTLRNNGTLKRLEQKWILSSANAPILK